MSQTNHSFTHIPTGPVPQNTGVHAIDHSFDRVIGRDAAEKWKVIQERQSYKREVIDSHKATGFDLSRTPDGDYRVMDKQERGMSERGRTLHKNAMKQKDKK